MNHQEREKYYPTFLHSGDAVQFIPEKARRFFALGISYELSLHLHAMLQFTPAQILEAMEQGRSVLSIQETGELTGFAQLWQYGFNENGQQILEFGSWLSFQKGMGERLLQEGIALGKQIDPDAQIIAVVEENNLSAQKTLIQSGAKEIDGKFSPVIKTVEGIPAFMKIFDITAL